MSPIDRLPLDVLLSIFHEVYATCRQPIGDTSPSASPPASSPARKPATGEPDAERQLSAEYRASDEPPIPAAPLLQSVTRWSDDDMLSPVRFPDALAAVSRSWRGALERVSAFWTRIVILVDTYYPTPLQHIQRRLDLSGKRLLEITICRHPASLRRYEDVFEPVTCLTVFNVLSCHVRRWKAFRMDILDPVSLTLCRTALKSSANNLIDLRLTFNLEGSRFGYVPAALQSPSLNSLDLDSVIFSSTYVLMPAPSPVPTMLSRLTLRGSIGSSGFTVLHLVNALRLMPRLALLHLIDVDFEPEYFGDSDCIQRLPKNIILEGLDRDALNEFLWLADVEIENLTLKRCSVWHPISAFLVRNLTIEQVTYSGSFKNVMGYFSCTSLTLRCCPALDGRTLKDLGAFQGPHDTWTNMKTVIIQDCSVLTCEDIVGFIEARPGLHHLVVEHCGELDPGDVERFRTSVVTKLVWNGEVLPTDCRFISAMSQQSEA